LQIDESTFGKSSLQVCNDLACLAELYQSVGDKKEAASLRQRAAKICHDHSSFDAMSVEFLQAYSKMLHELKFDKEATSIDTILSKRSDKGESSAQPASTNNSDKKAHTEEMENDPEYWQRTELVPIDGVEKFCTDQYDYIQVWYDKGKLRLEA